MKGRNLCIAKKEGHICNNEYRNILEKPCKKLQGNIPSRETLVSAFA
jgi:hypothetical protein